MQRFLVLLLFGLALGCQQSTPAPEAGAPATDEVAVETETGSASTRLISLNLPGMT